MNLGINGLYKLVSHEMDLPPLSGAVFIFFIKKIYHVGTISMPRLSYALSTSFTTRTTSLPKTA